MSRRTAITLVNLVSLSCAHGRGWFHRFPDRCERVHPSSPSQAPDRGRHPDFARLRPLRNYVRLRSIGLDEYHFTVWYGCIEPSVTDVAIAHDGTNPHELRGFWGGLGMPPSRPPPAVPAGIRPLADRVRAFVQDEHPDASIGAVMYHGHYREISVDEYIPYDAPRVGERLGFTRQFVFGASEDLATVVSPSVSFSGGGFGLMFAVSGDTARAPEWLDARVPDGPWVASVLEHSNRIPDALDALLALVREHRTVTLDALLAAQSDTLVPLDRRTRVAVAVDLYARPVNASGTQPSLDLAVQLDTSQLANGGTAEGETTATWLGSTYRLQARLAGLHAVDGTIHDAPATLSVRLEDSHRTVRESVLPVKVEGLSEEGRVAVVGLSLDLGIRGLEDARRQLRFPAISGYSSIDGYLGTNAFVVMGE